MSTLEIVLIIYIGIVWSLLAIAERLSEGPQWLAFITLLIVAPISLALSIIRMIVYKIKGIEEEEEEEEE